MGLMILTVQRLKMMIMHAEQTTIMTIMLKNNHGDQTLQILFNFPKP